VPTESHPPSSTTHAIPRGVWVLGIVSLLMDISSEMIHSLLPLYLTVGLGASALVTGENLGQVASQTVENMTAIQAVCRRVVLRPLTTYDKVETTDLARRIGTFETSILPFDDCCSLFVPRHPATKARAQDAERIEEALDVAAEVAAAVAGAERVMVT